MQIADGVNVYVFERNAEGDPVNGVRIRDLFDGDAMIPYDGGFIELVPADLPGDLNHDGAVGPADLAIVLGNWGSIPPNDPIADLNCDGTVGPADLAIILGNWG